MCRLLLYAKMQKETETEKTLGFNVTFLLFVAFQSYRLGPPSGYAYAQWSL